LQAFKHFYNDWLDCSGLDNPGNLNKKIEYLPMNLGVDFFQNLRFDIESLTTYRIDAAKKCAETLGDKPALCLSGGSDSQAMIQCFYEAGLEFDVYALAFNNDLNIHDMSFAREYTSKHNIKLNEIEINIHNFLTRENQEYAVKYNCYSPHFNTHFKLFNILKEKGYTSAVCGGNAPVQTVELDDRISWGGGYGRNQLAFIKYSQISGFLCQGNFLSFYPEFAWILSILTPISHYARPTSHITWKEKLARDQERYRDKIIGYRLAGLDIIPQETKYTGFELVKKYYEDMTGDGWTFEKRFRYPLEHMLKSDRYGLPEIYLTEEVRQTIEKLNKQYSVPNASSGITIQP
jgi:hypothetical protein